MESLNIAFYTDAYLPGMDGVVTSIINIRDELEKRGHNVYTFASADLRYKKKYSNSRVFLYSGVGFRPYPQYNVALFPYNSVFKLNELDIDIIHAQTPMVMGFAALMGAKLLDCPIVGSFHTMVTNKPIVDAYYPKNPHLKKFAATYMKKYTKFFYRRCNRVIAPTSSIKTLLNNYGIKNVSIVPNSIDMSYFNPKVSGDGVRRTLGLKDRDKVILYLGRLSKEKRIEVLLNAVKVLAQKDRNIRLVVGGKGPAEHYYKEMARKLGIMQNTKFIGFVSKDMLPSTYAAADTLCLPSTFETQGIVLLEAMAMGKPVVGADYLAIKEMIKSGRNGEKFRPGNYIECARKIEKVLNSTDHYKHDAIRTAAEFSKEKVADKLLDVYNLVLSRKAIY